MARTIQNIFTLIQFGGPLLGGVLALGAAVVGNRVEQDVVRPVLGLRILVHEPAGQAFESIQQLGIFHREWKAAGDAVEDRE